MAIKYIDLTELIHHQIILNLNHIYKPIYISIYQVYYIPHLLYDFVLRSIMIHNLKLTKIWDFFLFKFNLIKQKKT